jgi:hypothetical protein
VHTPLRHVSPVVHRLPSSQAAPSWHGVMVKVGVGVGVADDVRVGVAVAWPSQVQLHVLSGWKTQVPPPGHVVGVGQATQEHSHGWLGFEQLLKNPAGQGVSTGQGVNVGVGPVGVTVAQLPDARQTADGTNTQPLLHSLLVEADEHDGEPPSH